MKAKLALQIFSVFFSSTLKSECVTQQRARIANPWAVAQSNDFFSSILCVVREVCCCLLPNKTLCWKKNRSTFVIVQLCKSSHFIHRRSFERPSRFYFFITSLFILAQRIIFLYPDLSTISQFCFAWLHSFDGITRTLLGGFGKCTYVTLTLTLLVMAS